MAKKFNVSGNVGGGHIRTASNMLPATFPALPPATLSAADVGDRWWDAVGRVPPHVRGDSYNYVAVSWGMMTPTADIDGDLGAAVGGERVVPIDDVRLLSVVDNGAPDGSVPDRLDVYAFRLVVGDDGLLRVNRACPPRSFDLRKRPYVGRGAGKRRGAGESASPTMDVAFLTHAIRMFRQVEACRDADRLRRRGVGLRLEDACTTTLASLMPAAPAAPLPVGLFDPTEVGLPVDLLAEAPYASMKAIYSSRSVAECDAPGEIVEYDDGKFYLPLVLVSPEVRAKAKEVALDLGPVVGHAAFDARMLGSYAYAPWCARIDIVDRAEVDAGPVCRPTYGYELDVGTYRF